MVRFPRTLRPCVGGLVAVHCLVLLLGCGGEAPTPQIGSAEFEEQKKQYQDVRRQERGLGSFEPARGKTKKRASQ